jgi:hypothetical protein
MNAAGFFLLLLFVLGFELRASNLGSKCSSALAMPPVLFYSGYFGDRVSLFASLDCDPPILYFLGI